MPKLQLRQKRLHKPLLNQLLKPQVKQLKQIKPKLRLLTRKRRLLQQLQHLVPKLQLRQK